MAGSDWIFLIGFLACASSVALAADALLAGRSTTRARMVLAASLLLLAAGFALALEANLPLLPLLALGGLTLAAGYWLAMRARAARQPEAQRPPFSKSVGYVPSRLPAALVVTGLGLIGGAVLAGLDSADVFIPPPGTIVNAMTGDIVKKVVNRTTPQVQELSAELRACDLSVTPPCHYNKPGEPVTVHIGDVVEFSLELFDHNNQPVPYLEMYTEHTIGEIVRRANGSVFSRTYGGLKMHVHWPTRPGENQVDAAPGEPVEIIYPTAAKLGDLTYIAGSTVLFGTKDRVLAHLPDGIMEAGIALTDVGAPASCSYCETEYIRYVNFKVLVTNGGVS
jgi:hypothetical protein